MTRPKFIAIPTTTLKYSISTTETEITLTSLLDTRGNQIVLADFGTFGYFGLAPKTGTEEIIKFTALTRNADGSVTFTGVSRNCLPQDPYTSTGTGSAHGAGTIAVFSNHPQIYEALMDYMDDIAISGASDASLTAKGIVEVATETEIDADENFGATGASLSIRPDKLAASKYGTRLNTTAGKAFTDAVTGMVIPYAGLASPAGFLLCDNTAYSNDSYPTLLSIILGRYGYGTGTTFTTTHATDTINATGHGLSNGQIILLDTSASDLPNGLNTNTIYYVINQAANSFQVSTGSGGSAITFSDDGTGTHSYYTQFRVPDLRARFPLGYAASAPTKVFTFSSRSSNTITVTSDVLTNSTTNELQTGQKVNFVSSGTTITGLTSGVDYYLIRVAYNQFQLATSVSNANFGIAITLSGDGTGTRTFTATYTARELGSKGGTETDTTVPSHSHYPTSSTGVGGSIRVSTYNVSDDNAYTSYTTDPGSVIGTTGSSDANQMPLFTVLNYIIKT